MGAHQIFKVLTVFLHVSAITARGEYLQTYNVNPDSLTISGFSSGGAMAMQFHIAFSQEVHGSGIFSGLPYACQTFFNETECQTCVCHTAPTQALLNIVHSEAEHGTIDDPENLRGKKVYVFFGKNDSGLFPENGGKIADIYKGLDADLITELDMEAEHGYPTDFYGLPCGEPSAKTQLINNCNYHGAFKMLSHLYENLTPPNQSLPLTGKLQEFNQTEFTDGEAIEISLDSTGFIYVPKDCEVGSNNTCKVHLALHGCTQSRSAIGIIFATNTGYLQVADVNRIIVVFPQAAPNTPLGNRNGYWDWWDYLRNKNQINKFGPQMQFLHKIATRVLG